MAGRDERSRELGSRIGFYRHGRRGSFLSDEGNRPIGQLGQGCRQRPGSCATVSNGVASRAAGGVRGDLRKRQGCLVSAIPGALVGGLGRGATRGQPGGAGGVRRRRWAWCRENRGRRREMQSVAIS